MRRPPQVNDRFIWSKLAPIGLAGGRSIDEVKRSLHLAWIQPRRSTGRRAARSSPTTRLEIGHHQPRTHAAGRSCRPGHQRLHRPHDEEGHGDDCLSRSWLTLSLSDSVALVIFTLIVSSLVIITLLIIRAGLRVGRLNLAVQAV